jgi:hypothetical protein
LDSNSWERVCRRKKKGRRKKEEGRRKKEEGYCEKGLK